MKKKSLIETCILELECDNRIETGIFDVYNPDHLTMLVEYMVEFGMSEVAAEKLLESSLVDEGKYPERQAYNKDGWLVTFPSKEYRDRAIKKGTHFTSDPTHGKGGMNLYYKRKGKQKRQTQQDPTATQQTQPVAPAAKPAAPATAQPAPKQQAPTQPAPPTEPEASGEAVDDDDFDSRDDELMQYAAKKLGKDFQGKDSGDKPASSELPAADEPKPAAGEKPSSADAAPQAAPTPPPPPYPALSKEFATSKGWKPTDYGEYRDGEGNTAAVVGLSGEVVPVKSVLRDEFKLFVNKRGYG